MAGNRITSCEHKNDHFFNRLNVKNCREAAPPPVAKPQRNE